MTAFLKTALLVSIGNIFIINMFNRNNLFSHFSPTSLSPENKIKDNRILNESQNSLFEMLKFTLLLSTKPVPFLALKRITDKLLPKRASKLHFFGEMRFFSVYSRLKIACSYFIICLYISKAVIRRVSRCVSQK